MTSPLNATSRWPGCYGGRRGGVNGPGSGRPAHEHPTRDAGLYGKKLVTGLVRFER
jgi:hypothetical protein